MKRISTKDALQIVSDFKGSDLKEKLNKLRGGLLGKGKNNVKEPLHLYEAALVVKRISAQIDEMVHASGIIKCLPHILEDGEVIEDLSLASGADGAGIDLVTNKRIAEFKFSIWQEDKANGMRKRQVFGDLVQLHINPSKKKKEVYVMSYTSVIKFLNGKSKWENQLSKSGSLKDKLGDYLKRNRLNYLTVNDIYNISGVEVKSIEEILK
ncbi:MAG: hypothetical protein RLZZ500_506 [Bacteroidota bacterium]|jgi:hypothetical protein